MQFEVLQGWSKAWNKSPGCWGFFHVSCTWTKTIPAALYTERNAENSSTSDIIKLSKIWLQVDFDNDLFCCVWTSTGHPERNALTSSKCVHVFDTAFVAEGKQYCTEANKSSSSQRKAGLGSPQWNCDPQPNTMGQAFKCKLLIPLQSSRSLEELQANTSCCSFLICLEREWQIPSQTAAYCRPVPFPICSCAGCHLCKLIYFQCRSPVS